MPLYYFSVEGPHGRIDDDQAERFDDDTAAHYAVQQTARELAGGSLQGSIVTVRRENGSVVTEVPVGKPPLS